MTSAAPGITRPGKTRRNNNPPTPNFAPQVVAPPILLRPLATKATADPNPPTCGSPYAQHRTGYDQSRHALEGMLGARHDRLKRTQDELHALRAKCHPLSFEEAKRRLARPYRHTYERCQAEMEQSRITSRLVGALYTLDAQQLRRTLSGQPAATSRHPGYNSEHNYHYIDLSAIEEHALHVLASLFPCETDWMGEEMLNMECADHMHICLPPIGWCWGNDEFFQLMEDPTEISPEHCALDFFLWALGSGEGVELWNTFNDHFGWGVPFPDPLEDDCETDWDGYYQLLEDNDLPEIKLVYDILGHCTGNPFLDADPYNECSYGEDLVDFTAAKIVWLAEEWPKAQLLLDEWRMANERARADPHIYHTIVRLYRQARKKREPRTIRGEPTP